MNVYGAEVPSWIVEAERSSHTTVETVDVVTPRFRQQCWRTLRHCATVSGVLLQIELRIRVRGQQ